MSFKIRIYTAAIFLINGLLDCDNLQPRRRIPMFRRNMLLPSSGLNYTDSEAGSGSKVVYKEGGQKIQGRGTSHFQPVTKNHCAC